MSTGTWGSLSSNGFPLTATEKDLYNGMLYTRINKKFKRIQVNLKEIRQVKDKPVYHLRITGINHSFRTVFDFTTQELCFLRQEECQEDEEDESCIFSCLNRNYYPVVRFNALTLLLYKDGVIEGGPTCIKIQVLQKGMFHEQTDLGRLLTVLRKCLEADPVNHWQVHVHQFGNFREGERLFLGLTRFGLLFVKNYQILQYHALHGAEITMSHTATSLDIKVSETSTSEQSGGGQNFYLSRSYAFSTSFGWEIEASFVRIMQQKYFEFPRPHYNILPPETSSNGAIPGSKSSEVMDVKVQIHPEPSPVHSSDGTVVNVDGMTSLETDVLSSRGPNPHTVQSGQGSGSSNGHISNTRIDTVVQAEHILGERPPSHEQSIPGLSWPTSYSTSGTFEMDEVHSIFSDSQHRGTPMSLTKSFDDYEDNTDHVPAELSDLEAMLSQHGVSDDDPLPSPCKGSSFHALHSPIVQISRFFEVPESHRPKRLSDKDNDYLDVVPERIPARKPLLLRSQSFSDILLTKDFSKHTYINTEKFAEQSKSAHDDSIYYYRFYFNFGYILMEKPTMRKKIRRRSRLSDMMEDVDFNVLEKHEKWYDHCYKARNKDLKFLKIHNLPVEEVEQPKMYDVQMGYEVSVRDDPYWNGDLCLTIQRLLQDKKPNLQDTFDMTREQESTMVVLLSLVPVESNWKQLAEHLGLVNEDIQIISHYCYTYRELAAEVVLAHWVLQEKRKRQICPCTREQLFVFLKDMDREDILNILSRTDENVHVQIEEVFDTHL